MSILACLLNGLSCSRAGASGHMPPSTLHYPCLSACANQTRIADGVLMSAESAGLLVGAGIKGSTTMEELLRPLPNILLQRRSSAAQVLPHLAQASYPSHPRTSLLCLLHTTSISLRAPCQSMCLASSRNSRPDTTERLPTTASTRCRRQNDQKVSLHQGPASTPALPASTLAASTTPPQEERPAWICWIT